VLVAHHLPHDEAGVADRCQTGSDAQLIAGERLGLVRSFHFADDRPQARAQVLGVRHVTLERRPAGALHQRQHVGVIDVAH